MSRLTFSIFIFLGIFFDFKEYWHTFEQTYVSTIYVSSAKKGTQMDHIKGPKWTIYKDESDRNKKFLSASKEWFRDVFVHLYKNFMCHLSILGNTSVSLRKLGRFWSIFRVLLGAFLYVSMKTCASFLCDISEPQFVCR